MEKSVWVVRFGTDISANSFGEGVVLIDGDRITGFDLRYFYDGKITLKDNRAEAQFDVMRYRGEPWSVYGPAKQFVLDVGGVYHPKQFTMGGHIRDNPRTPGFVVALTRQL